MDVVLFVEVDEGGLGEVGVHLDLVDGGGMEASFKTFSSSALEKLEMPMALHLPFLTSFSIAL